MEDLPALLVFAVLFAAIFTTMMAALLRAGLGRGVEPLAFRHPSKRESLELAWTTAGRMGLAIGLIAVPGPGFAVLGYWRRAALWFAVFLAVRLGIPALGDACGCEVGQPEPVLWFTLLSALGVPLMIIGCAFDTARCSMRQVLNRSVDLAPAQFAAAEAGLPSCPRCRQHSRGTLAFCVPCAAQLEQQAVPADSPWVRAVVDPARATDPALQALRHAQFVRGRFAGDAMRVQAKSEPKVDARMAKLCEGYRTVTRGAWLDPVDPRCLWLWIDSAGTLPGGRHLESGGICLAVFTGGKLSAYWAMTPFHWRLIPAGQAAKVAVTGAPAAA